MQSNQNPNATSVQVFQNTQFGEVRVAVNEKGETMFCLSDLCKAIDLTNPSSVKSRLEDDQIQLFDLHALNYIEGLEINGLGNSFANFVNESGFYDVLLQSSSKKVKPFRKWVTSEVLPTMRKTGGYILAGQNDTPDVIMARALLVAKDTIDRVQAEKERLLLTSKEQERQLKEAAPKVEYHDKVLESKSKISVNSIALCLGITNIKLNKLLCQWGVQYVQSGVYFLTAKYRDQGLAKHFPFPYIDSSGSPQTKQHLYWNEAGKKIICDMYEKNCLTLETV